MERTLDTPVRDLTAGQLMDMMGGMRKPWMVHSLKELAAAIDASYTTVWRMKKSGIIDPAISQFGRWCIIDVWQVLDILRLAKRKRI